MKTIYIAIGREAVGPLSHEEVKKGLKDGRWDSKFRIWHPGLENWTPLHQVEMDRSTIVSEFASSPPPIPPWYPGGKALFGLAGIVALIALCLFFTRAHEPHLLAQNIAIAQGVGMENSTVKKPTEEKSSTSQGKNSQLNSESSNGESPPAWVQLVPLGILFCIFFVFLRRRRQKETERRQ